jgi:hypothetical protein
MNVQTITPSLPRDRTHLPVITTSEVRCFQRCRREHLLRYRMKLRPVVEQENLRFGSLVHKGLEAWWRAWPSEDALDIAIEAMQPAEGVEVDAYELVRAEELLRGYHHRWRDQGYEVLGVEETFVDRIVNPMTGAASRTAAFSGKIDALVRELSTGRVLVVEHKTSSEDISLGSAYWRRLRLDPQVSNYFIGGRALGHNVVGCLYDVLGKPGLRPAKATPVEARKYRKTDGKLYENQRENDETVDEYRVRVREKIASEPEAFFARGEVVRSEDDEHDAAQDLFWTARDMREAELAGRFPRNPSGCVRYGYTCDFFDVCTHVASADDPTRFRVAETEHEELTPTH